jgi:hypothetical protein
MKLRACFVFVSILLAGVCRKKHLGLRAPQQNCVGLTRREQDPSWLKPHWRSELASGKPRMGRQTSPETTLLKL